VGSAHRNPKQGATVGSLIEEQRSLAASKNPLERLFGALSFAGSLKKELASLPDKSIGQLMFDHVWNELNLLSPEMTICTEATERLLRDQFEKENE